MDETVIWLWYLPRMFWEGDFDERKATGQIYETAFWAMLNSVKRKRGQRG